MEYVVGSPQMNRFNCNTFYGIGITVVLSKWTFVVDWINSENSQEMESFKE